MSSVPMIPAVWAMKHSWDSHHVYFDCPHCGRTHSLDDRNDINKDGTAIVYCRPRGEKLESAHIVVVNNIKIKNPGNPQS